jgi:hypothetical protein
LRLRAISGGLYARAAPRTDINRNTKTGTTGGTHKRYEEQA